MKSGKRERKIKEPEIDKKVILIQYPQFFVAFYRTLQCAERKLIVISIIPARLTTLEAYRAIALVTVFANVFQAFINIGMGNARIPKKDAGNLNFILKEPKTNLFNICMECLGSICLSE